MNTSGFDMAALVKKIMDYPVPTQTPVDPAAVLAADLIAGLSDTSPTMTTKSLYNRLSTIALPRDVQVRFMRLYESLTAPSKPEFVRGVVSDTSIVRLFANYAHYKTVASPQQFMPPPGVRPMTRPVGVSPVLASAAVEYVINATRAITRLRSTPACRLPVPSIANATPIPTAVELFEADGGILRRADSGSSIVTRIVQILDGDIAHADDPVSACLQLETNLVSLGNNVIADLKTYYTRSAYPHDTVVGPLARLQAQGVAFSEQCSSWLPRLLAESTGVLGVIETRTKIIEACADLKTASATGDPFSMTAPSRMTPEDEAVLSAELDDFAAHAYCLSLVRLGRVSMPDPDQHDDHAQKDAERDLHERCCLEMHRVMDQAIRTVYEYCDSDVGDSLYNRLRRVHRVGVRAYDDLASAMLRIGQEAQRAVQQIQKPDNFTVLRVGQSVGIVPVSDAQRTAWNTLCGGTEKMPVVFVDAVKRLRDLCLERAVHHY